MRGPESTDIRSQVLAAATRLFAAHGFDGTSLQAIADEVGVTKPGVLHHFPSKEHLRRAVLDEILAHWGETLPRLLLAATASEERFDTVFGEVYRFFAADPDRARVIIREVFDRPAEVRALLGGPLRPIIDSIATYIRSGQTHQRHYPDVDAEAYVLHVLQLVLTAAGSADVTAAALDPAKDARARYDRELARIAKASLFLPAAPRERRKR